ncbi:hypothetical protein HQ45_00180 [Porphyromonas crevioricanis]|uniref:Uncharacterized protein n=1 Tax=Porphyromonas crevioricanis TaxID=393921 RepID=A0AB34PDW3_9PORP|nr:Omp28-related outer membrane protein [Porphyromonas crevioricanis]KGN91238.1 hypothetical protein HQ45_00180 [Porphyromonas crevioricanis]KGN93060.1 hypothetical protein HQ38_09860 [Porphyromonas crevioricanis]
MKRKLQTFLLGLIALCCFPATVFAQQQDELKTTEGYYYLGYDEIENLQYSNAMGYDNINYITSVALGSMFPYTKIKDFVDGGEAVGVRIAVAVPVKQAEVFIIGWPDDFDKKKASKIVNLEKGWNEIIFDTPVPIPYKEPLTIGYFYQQKLQESPQIILTDGNLSTVEEATLIASNGKKFKGQGQAVGALHQQLILRAKPEITDNLIQLANIKVNPVVVSQSNIGISFDIQNFGSNKINKLDISYFVNGEKVHNEAYETAIMPRGFTYLKVASLKAKNGDKLSIRVNKINDKPKDLLLKEIDIAGVLPKAFDRVTLMEQFSTEMCSSCPKAHHLIHQVLEKPKFSPKVAWAVHHVGFKTDKFTLEESNSLLPLFGAAPPSAPAIMLDRMSSKLNTRYTYPAHYPGKEEATLEGYITEALERPAVVSLDVKDTYVAENRKLKIEIDGQSVKGFLDQDDCYINVYIVEDHIYSEDQNGTGTSATTATGKNPIWHMGVIRQFVTPKEGIKLTFDEAGNFKYNTEIDFKQEWTGANTRIVAFAAKKLRDNILKTPDACEVYNAANRPITAFLGIEAPEQTEVKVFPLKDKIVAEGENASIQDVYTMDGRRIQNEGLLPGTYIVRIQTSKGTFARKIRID